VELVELSLEVDELEAELAVDVVEALLVELAESAVWRARSRLCKSLLSLETELDGGGGGGGGGPSAGGGPSPGGGPSDEALAELTEDAVVALVLELAAWLDAANSCCSSCQADEPLDEPTDPMDMAYTFHGRATPPGRSDRTLEAIRGASIKGLFANVVNERLALL
jgi:hypothetical protein